MKSQFNKTVVGAVVLSALLSPLAVFAESTSSTSTKPRIDKNNFCVRLVADSQKLLRGFEPKMDERTTKQDEKEKARIQKLAGLRVDHDLKRSENREDAKVKRDTRYDALMNKADTDAKKAAVTAYKNAVGAATTKRVAAVDAAVKAYRDGVDALIKSKFTSLDTGAATLRTAVEAAIAKAKADCAANVSPATVRTQLMAAAKAAQNVFKANRNDAAIKTGIEALNKTRKAAVEAALATFKTDMQKATADLKTAFGVK
ncbi:MAG TPA: hypothetical protein VJ579_04880 [Candidatus Paceibacterota bacterium]|nr:hypothetical protein [Candidatus Paceibacterota bacterium]